MNFNLNSINKKIVIYLSLIGFVLSFISGIISGNNFGILLFRSLLSGIIMGVVIIIANFVVISFLPELLADEASSDDDFEDDDSKINIVMPEEKYKVQTDNTESNTSEVVEDQSHGDESTPAFKEVDLDNLKGLSAASTENFVDESESYSESDSNYSSGGSSSSNSELGDQNPEVLAKAIKTVLKRD